MNYKVGGCDGWCPWKGQYRLLNFVKWKSKNFTMFNSLYIRIIVNTHILCDFCFLGAGAPPPPQIRPW